MASSDDPFWHRRFDRFDPPAERPAEFTLLPERWRWIEHMRQRFGTAIEVLDRDLTCVLDVPSRGHAGALLRAALQDRRDTTVRDMAAMTLRAGAARFVSSAGLRVRMIPLLASGDATAKPGGVLAIAEHLPERTMSGIDAMLEVDHRLEGISHWLAPAVEATIETTRYDVERSETAKRLEGIVEVVGALERLDDEDDVVQQLMEAGGLWYGNDVRVYRQDATGAFVLEDYLPGLDLHRVPSRLAGSLVSGHDGVFRLGSSEAEALHWDRSPGETLFMPIGVHDSTDWLIAVSGTAGASVGPTLTFLHHLAGIVLENIEWRRRAHLQRVLADILPIGDAPFESAARLGLQALAHEVDASSIELRITPQNAQGVPLSVEWRDAESDERKDGRQDDTNHGTTVSERVGGIVIALTLRRRGRALTAAASRLARTALEMYGLWVAGILTHPGDVRVPADAERSIELVGRLKGQVDAAGCLKVGGAVAVVLPEPSPPTGPELDEAMRIIQDHVRASDIIGLVDNGGAGVLLANASETVAAALVSRLREAARERGLARARIGMTTFGPFSEPPEALLMRASAQARGRDTSQSA